MTRRGAADAKVGPAQTIYRRQDRRALTQEGFGSFPGCLAVGGRKNNPPSNRAVVKSGFGLE
jgi:hypothetical protein